MQTISGRSAGPLSAHTGGSLWTMTSPAVGERAPFRTLNLMDGHAEAPRIEVTFAPGSVWCGLEEVRKTGISGSDAGGQRAGVHQPGGGPVAYAHGVALHRAASRCRNAFIESFNGKFGTMPEPELVGQPGGGPEIIEAWRVDYNTVRPHSSLDIEPAEFAGNRGKKAVERRCGKVQTTFPLRLEIPQTRRIPLSHSPAATNSSPRREQIQKQAPSANL